MKDILNNELEVGQKIAYAQRAGNTADLRTGTIIELREDAYCQVIIESDKKAVARRIAREVVVIDE